MPKNAKPTSKTAPGPPAVMATATPEILPIPTVAAMAVIKLPCD